MEPVVLTTLEKIKRTIKGKSYPLHRNEKIEPLFVVGCGRSGTTLVRRILLASRQIHIPPEAKFLGESIKVFQANRMAPWKKIVRLVLSTWEYNKTFKGWDLCLADISYELQDLPKERRSLAVILDAVYSLHMAKFGEGITRWGDKTPANTKVMDDILSVFPNALFLNVVRDGADVVDAHVRAGFLGGDPVRAARHWVESVEASRRFAARHADRIMTVRYEDLVTEPAMVMQQICAFAKIDYDDSMLEDIEPAKKIIRAMNEKIHHKLRQPISPAFIGQGRKALSPHTRNQIARIVNETLLRCGYQQI